MSHWKRVVMVDCDQETWNTDQDWVKRGLDVSRKWSLSRIQEMLNVLCHESSVHFHQCLGFPHHLRHHHTSSDMDSQKQWQLIRQESVQEWLDEFRVRYQFPRSLCCCRWNQRPKCRRRPVIGIMTHSQWFKWQLMKKKVLCHHKFLHRNEEDYIWRRFGTFSYSYQIEGTMKMNDKSCCHMLCVTLDVECLIRRRNFTRETSFPRKE